MSPSLGQPGALMYTGKPHKPASLQAALELDGMSLKMMFISLTTQTSLPLNGEFTSLWFGPLTKVAGYREKNLGAGEEGPTGPDLWVSGLQCL